MARPTASGIDYFPLDTDIDQDDKIALVEADFGMKGFGVIVKLLMKIYSEGYFYNWEEKEQKLFARRVNVDINYLSGIVNACIRWDFFEKDLFVKYCILTSKGIQKRYFEATSRRKGVEVVEDYLLLTKKELNKYPNLVYVDNEVSSAVVNVDIKPPSTDQMSTLTTQSKVKETKVKESKLKDSIDEKEILEINFKKLWDLYPRKTNQFEAFQFYKIAIEKSVTNKEIQTGIVNYNKYLKINHTEPKFVKTDVNFFREKYWENHQEEPVVKYGQKDESAPEWFKKQKEKRETPNQVVDSTNPNLAANEAALRERLRALGIGGDANEEESNP